MSEIRKYNNVQIYLKSTLFTFLFNDDLNIYRNVIINRI